MAHLPVVKGTCKRQVCVCPGTSTLWFAEAPNIVDHVPTLKHGQSLAEAGHRTALHAARYPIEKLSVGMVCCPVHLKVSGRRFERIANRTIARASFAVAGQAV